MTKLSFSLRSPQHHIMEERKIRAAHRQSSTIEPPTYPASNTLTQHPSTHHSFKHHAHITRYTTSIDKIHHDFPRRLKPRTSQAPAVLEKEQKREKWYDADEIREYMSKRTIATTTPIQPPTIKKQWYDAAAARDYIKEQKRRKQLQLQATKLLAMKRTEMLNILRHGLPEVNALRSKSIEQSQKTPRPSSKNTNARTATVSIDQKENCWSVECERSAPAFTDPQHNMKINVDDSCDVACPSPSAPPFDSTLRYSHPASSSPMVDSAQLADKLAKASSIARQLKMTARKPSSTHSLLANDVGLLSSVQPPSSHPIHLSTMKQYSAPHQSIQLASAQTPHPPHNISETLDNLLVSASTLHNRIISLMARAPHSAIEMTKANPTPSRVHELSVFDLKQKWNCRSRAATIIQRLWRSQRRPASSIVPPSTPSRPFMDDSPIEYFVENSPTSKLVRQNAGYPGTSPGTDNSLIEKKQRGADNEDDFMVFDHLRRHESPSHLIYANEMDNHQGSHGKRRNILDIVTGKVCGNSVPFSAQPSSPVSISLLPLRPDQIGEVEDTAGCNFETLNPTKSVDSSPKVSVQLLTNDFSHLNSVNQHTISVFDPKATQSTPPTKACSTAHSSSTTPSPSQSPLPFVGKEEPKLILTPTPSSPTEPPKRTSPKSLSKKFIRPWS